MVNYCLGLPDNLKNHNRAYFLMSFENIKMLLQKNIGLYSGSVGESSIERAILLRMETLNIDDNDLYYTRLMNDQDELEELVEEVVVPETWFFRNKVPFETISKTISGLNEGKSTLEFPIRILSLPCSTGEEPYSIAITLMKNGMEKGSFTIDAVDISRRAIRRAKRAIYGKNSFRESNGIADPAYFQQTGAGQQVLPVIKEHVNFIKGNILKDTLVPGPEYYDVIFCRNLLIYFDRDTQKRVLEKLNTMLKKNGTLFMGHAETTESAKNLFIRLDIPRAFAYKKKTSTDVSLFDGKYNHPTESLEDIYNKLVGITLKDIELAKKHKKSPYQSNYKRSRNRGALNRVNVSNIEKLIEQGRLSAASALCESWLEENPEEAQGYYLLGLISNLEGNIGSADALLKKAIYLDPNHLKALGLSAHLAEQRGDAVVAQSLRFRENRAKKRVQ